MNTFEQRVREFAYQIWESEGCPIGHEYRHWEMARKLAQQPVNLSNDLMGSARVLSMITPEEPFDPNPKPEIDPAPPQPGQPSPPPTPTPPPPANPEEPAEPISPVEPPPHISPTPPAEPIHPTDPVQPGNPNQPIQPYASKRTTNATKAALASDGVTPASNKTPTKPRKARSSQSQRVMSR